MAQKIKKGDTVLVIAGNDRGRTGVVLHRSADRIAIQGINIRKKHIKKRAEVQTPGIIEIEVPVHISNVCLCDSEGKKIKRVVGNV